MKKLLAVLLLIPSLALAQANFNSRAVVNAASSGDNTIIAAVSNLQTSIWGFDLAVASTAVVTLKCGATAITGPMTVAALYQKMDSQGPAYWTCPINTAFIINLGSGVQVSGTVWYSQQ